jgi:transposase
MARIEVVTGPERRRMWSDEQKRALVAEASAPGAVVAEIARRADVGSGQIYRWRRQLREAASGFAAVVVTSSENGVPVDPGAARVVAPAIEVEFVGTARVRIPASIPPALAAAVVRALAKG